MVNTSCKKGCDFYVLFQKCKTCFILREKSAKAICVKSAKIV